MKDQLIGIDLGGTTTKFGLFHVDGTILKQWAIPTDIRNDGAYIVENMILSIQKETIDLATVLGIGIGCPGVVNHEAGTVSHAYNLGWKTDQQIRMKFKEAFDLPVYLANDANVAAYGEAWLGASANDQNSVFITLGTGVGGGIILRDEILVGENNSAGEIGHLQSAHHYNFTCTCGNKNCLETIASATGIKKVAIQEAKHFIGSSVLKSCIEIEEDFDAKTVFDLAKSGDIFANNVVDIIAYDLGVACGNIANLLNPKSIIIGGGVSQAGDFLSKKIVSVFEEVAFPLMKKVTEVKLATLGNDAGIIGAAHMVLKGESVHV